MHPRAPLSCRALFAALALSVTPTGAFLAANPGDSIRATKLVDKRFAIVTGLYNLDGVHAFPAELHPVYAMSVLLDAVEVNGRMTETWAVMVRDRGNQGDCATGRTPMFTEKQKPGDQRFTIDLGSWEGAESPTVSLGPSWGTRLQPIPTMRNVRGKRLLLEFKYPHPVPGSNDFLFLGTVIVRWGKNSGRPFVASPLSSFISNASEVHIGSYESHDIDKSQSKQLWSTPEDKSGGRVIKALTRFPDLMRFPAGDLPAASDGWSQPTQALAYRAEQWLDQDPLEIVDCKTGEQRSDFLCRGKWRVALAPLSVGANRSWAPMLSIFVHAHSWEWAGRAADLSDFFSGFAYRLDFRRDAYNEKTIREQRIVEVHRYAKSARLSAILSPNSKRVSASLTIIPYLIAGLGGSFVNGNGWTATAGFGGGFHFAWRRGDYFIESQRYNTFGHYEGAQGVAVGLMLPGNWPW